MRHTLKWFENRIGKRIFRDNTKKHCCEHCDRVSENGLIVRDTTHADYLHSVQNAFWSEGEMLNYRNKK